MRIILYIFLLCLFDYSNQKSTPDSPYYVAAVVEYEVIANVSTNLNNYLGHIQHAAGEGSDIIVFPEMTLTTSNYAVPVPMYTLLKDYPVPALHEDLYDKVLVEISAAARLHEIYVVINIQEKMDCVKDIVEECPERRVYLFNTNVVFDRSGAVISRYRKINLFGEYTRSPALNPDLAIFSTDFGVTFGHFICFDLMFQVPAIQLVEKHSITDVIFTTMWFSELPFLTAVQIQASYAYALNVNFLAAGANNVRVGSAGSGIYSGKAGALISIMPGVPTTRVLISKVPKIPGELNLLSNEVVPGPIKNHPEEQDLLYLLVDSSLPAYDSRPLETGSHEITIKQGHTNCKFKYRLLQNDGDKAQQYKYRAIVFDGVRSFSGVESGGIQACAIVACTGDDKDSCGKRFSEYQPNSSRIFEELTIVATVPTPVTNVSLQAQESAYYPISLTTDIMPLEPRDFTYKVENMGDTTVISNELKIFNIELYTFAVWGRFFPSDGQNASLPIPDSNSGTFTVRTINVFLLLALVMLASLLPDSSS